MIRTKVLVAGIVLLTLVYVFGLAQRAWVLLVDPGLFAKTFGLLLVVFPALAVWAIWSEIRFGVRCESLGKKLFEQNFPELQIETRASGRPDTASALKAAEQLKLQARLAPDDWRTWFRLAEALDASGDRKAARQAARTAIRLEGAA